MTVLLLVSLILFVAGGALAYRALRQASAARRLAIRNPAGVQETGFVDVRGAPQWVSIRGEDRANPAILVLHGGPGAAFAPLTYEALRPWEAEFTVVHWDQPGAGLTHGRHGEAIGELSLDRIVRDGLAVAEYALGRLGHNRLFLLGASWGSIVGVEMARRRPDLFHAYVGAGQVVDMVRNEEVGYQALAERLRARRRARALAKLETIGPPPYAGLKPLLAQRRILMANPPASERGLSGRAVLGMLFAPGYRLKDLVDWFNGSLFSVRRLLDAMMAYRDDIAALAVPVVFIQGDEDIQTPTVLVQAYAARFRAPSKQLVLIPGGGHNALIAMPDMFLQQLRTFVRPLAAQPQRR